jgi:hypothetical protein
MTESSIVPGSFKLIDQEDESFYSFNQGEPVASMFVDASREGWKTVVYEAAVEALQNKIDIEDSLKSLKESEGVSLQDYRQELGV